MSSLRTRAITATFFVIIMVGGIFWNNVSFVILFGIINLLMLWEYYGLTFKEGIQLNGLRKIIATLLAISPFVFVTLSMWFKSGLQIQSPFFVFLWVAALSSMFILEMYSQSEKPFENVAHIMLGMFYITLPLILLNFIAYDPATELYSPIRVFSLLLMIWANDTGAYFVGSRIGKTPLLPRISPKKTWEGTIGGIILTLLTAVLLNQFYSSFGLQHWLGLALVVAFFGSMGDLVESMLKRSLGVKDSGNLLPGHGGLLDRFDAFIFMLPFAAAYILLFKL